MRALKRKYPCLSASAYGLAFTHFLKMNTSLSPTNGCLAFGVPETLLEAARPQALLWALERGSRSGRVAYQFARDFACEPAGGQ